MSDLSDYQAPTPPPERELEPIFIFLSGDEVATVSRHTFSHSTIDIQRDYAKFYKIPNASSLPSNEIFRILFSENLAIPLHPQHTLIESDLGQQIVRRADVETPDDTEPQQLEQDEEEIRSSVVQAVTDGKPPIGPLSTLDDGGPQREGSIPERHQSLINQPLREPSISDSSPLQDRVEPEGHPDPEPPQSPTYFQNKFEQLRNQHNDLRTRINQTKFAARDAAADALEASALFRAEEAKLQEILTRVRNIMGPRVAKWIEEDVAASMEAGKLVCRDFSLLNAELNRSNDEDDDPSKSRRGDGEGNDEAAIRINSERKGKGKEKENDQSYGSNDTNSNTKASGSRTRSNQRKRSAESQLDENIGRQKRSKISPAVSSRSPSLVPEKPSSLLKRTREEFEDTNDDGSEDEVEKSITIHGSFSSILEDSGPVSKKTRRQESHVYDIPDVSASPSLSGFSTSPRHGPSVSSQTGTTDSRAGPSGTGSQPTSNHLFPPSAFPRVRPPRPPKRPRELTAKPLQRDTRRVRMNPDTGEFEVYDYESTQEYYERLQRDRYNSIFQAPVVCDTKADFRTISELDGPRFKFDRDAWRDFEDYMLTSEC